MSKNNTKIDSDRKPLANLLILYKAFLYFLEPYYTDKRGDEIRKKIRKLLLMTKEQEDAFIDKLKKSKVIEEVGNAIFIKNRTSVRGIVNQIMADNKFDIDKFLRSFIEYGK